MTDGTQVISPSGTNTSQTSLGKSRRPWSFASMAAASIVLGVGASYLIVWQNLKRLGRDDIARKFFLVGLVILIGVITVLFFAEEVLHLSKASGNVLALGFPVWFYFKYLVSWKISHSEKPGFSWSIIWWGLLGLVISLGLVGFLTLIFS